MGVEVMMVMKMIDIRNLLRGEVSKAPGTGRRLCWSLIARAACSVGSAHSPVLLGSMCAGMPGREDRLGRAIV